MKYEFFNSPVHGIGCKSTQDIKEGDIVNKEPFFIVPRHIKNYANSVFGNYYWTVENKLHLLMVLEITVIIVIIIILNHYLSLQMNRILHLLL